jgi:hypothetical protein
VKSWLEEDLILHHYGEHPRSEEIERALAEDPDLRRRLEELRLDLERVEDPAIEPEPAFEDRLWRALRPRLERRGARWTNRWTNLWPGFSFRLVAMAATLVLVAGLAFLLGRQSVPEPAPPSVAASSAARDRVLFASVGRHLESSGLLLTDLANAPSDGDLGGEAEWARALLASNRLYRQAAERSGQRRIVALLDELEPVLVELAHRPTGGGVSDLQHRISERDLLFKVRTVGGRLESHRL